MVVVYCIVYVMLKCSSILHDMLQPWRYFTAQVEGVTAHVPCWEKYLHEAVWINNEKPVDSVGNKAVQRKLVSCANRRGLDLKPTFVPRPFASLSRQSWIVCTQHPPALYRGSWKGQKMREMGGAGILELSSWGWRVRGRLGASETCLDLLVNALTTSHFVMSCVCFSDQQSPSC